MATAAPERRNRSTIARPMPWAPPVTTAMRPSRSMRLLMSPVLKPALATQVNIAVRTGDMHSAAAPPPQRDDSRLADDRALVPAPQHEMREERHGEINDDPGQRQQHERRKHPRNLEPIPGFGDPIGEPGAGSGGASGDLGHHRADQR